MPALGGASSLNEEEYQHYVADLGRDFFWEIFG